MRQDVRVALFQINEEYLSSHDRRKTSTLNMFPVLCHLYFGHCYGSVQIKSPHLWKRRVQANGKLFQRPCDTASHHLSVSVQKVLLRLMSIQTLSSRFQTERVRWRRKRSHLGQPGVLVDVLSLLDGRRELLENPAAAGQRSGQTGKLTPTCRIEERHKRRISKQNDGTKALQLWITLESQRSRSLADSVSMLKFWGYIYCHCTQVCTTECGYSAFTLHKKHKFIQRPENGFWLMS